MKKILMIVTYDYLAFPLFNSLNKILSSDFKMVLAFINEPFIEEDRQLTTPKYDLKDWSEVISPKSNNLDKIQKIINEKKYLSNILTFLKGLRGYKSEIIEIILKIRPNMIISTTDLTFSSRIINKVTQENNIPYILFQPSFINSNSKNIFNKIKNRILYIIFNKILKLPLISRQPDWGNESSYSIKFLWGSSFTDVVSKCNYRIVGNPLLNEYFKVYESNQKNDILMKKMVIDESSTVVTICSEGFCGIINEEPINELYKKIIENNKNLIFIIKVHPRDNYDYYYNYFSVCGNYVRITKDINLFELYRITDLQISVNSYSSVEAILCGIPVILVKRSLIKLPDYFKGNVALHAETLKEFQDCLNLALDSRYRKKFNENRAIFLMNVFGGTDSNEINTNILNSVKSLFN